MSMKRFIPALTLFVVILHFCLAGFAEAGKPAKGSTAYYRSQSGSEGDQPPAALVRVDMSGQEEQEGKAFTWWEMSVTTRDGNHYGIRVLSEHAAMTAPGHELDPSGIGIVSRYLYRDLNGRVFEYRDETTGKALLPLLDFRLHFLPVPSRDAGWDDGFASTGVFQGHTLTRINPIAPPEKVSFDNANLLVLRSDLLMGAQASGRNDYVPLKPGDSLPEQRPYTQQELKDLIDAGINFFGDIGEFQSWLKEQPVYFRSAPSFPDSFYRSNYYPGGMFIDEPSIRFGWDPEIPSRCLYGPEQHAQALETRVRSHYLPTKRFLKVGWHVGSMELYTPNNNSWDTNYYSAWYQLAAGAPALIVEGRYRKRGYGWYPEAFFGREGLEELTFADQMNCMNAFMRGAARAFHGDWGVSVYPEGHPELFADAFKQSYDMGAKHLWFWIHPPVVSHTTMLDLGRVMKDHIASHPRGDKDQANRQAATAIVLPKGYAITPEGSVWGFESDETSRGGALYGDIAAAAMSEALICSRQGIPFDFVVDVDFIKDLGYRQLIYVGEDGSLKPEPSWKEERAPRGLDLSLVESASAPIIARATPEADFRIQRAKGLTIDGNLEDWNTEWIPLGSSEVSSDLINLDVSVPNVASPTLYQQYSVSYLGFKFEQLNKELQKQLDMEDYHIIGPEVVDENRPGISLEQGAVIITEVRPDSPAAQAGLRAGDVIRAVNGRDTKWHFVVWGLMNDFAKKGPEPITFSITRNEHARSGYPGDLEAKCALAVDDANLYFAAQVTDDTHSQPFEGWYIWQGDCVQLAFDPTLARNGMGYTEEDHEIAFVLRDDGTPLAWRFQGRRGQPREAMKNLDLQIVRQGSITQYEAAIPLTDLAPMAPDLWNKIGFNIVIDDHDGAGEFQRKGRLEMRPGAMTRGKSPAGFAVMQFEPSPDQEKVSAAILWRRRATLEDGFFRLLLGVSSPENKAFRILGSLESLDSPRTRSIQAEVRGVLSPEPKEWNLRVDTQSPPGRYALSVSVEDENGHVVARDRLPVHVFPKSH